MVMHIDPLNCGCGPLSRHNSAVVWRMIMKFIMETHFDPLQPSDGQKFDFLENPDGGCRQGVHISATWRIRLNRPCAAAMRPYVRLF